MNLREQLEAIRINNLEWNKETKDFDNIEVGPTVFERDGVLFVSAEDGKGFADYYSEEAGCPDICKELEAFAKKHGMFWEWCDPGSIALYKN